MFVIIVFASLNLIRTGKQTPTQTMALATHYFPRNPPSSRETEYRIPPHGIDDDVVSPLLEFLRERLLHHLLLHPANLALVPYGHFPIPLLVLGLVPLTPLAAIDAQVGAPLAEIIVIVVDHPLRI